MSQVHSVAEAAEGRQTMLHPQPINIIVEVNGRTQHL